MSHSREISTLREAIAIISRYEGGWHRTIADLDALATRLEESGTGRRPLAHDYGTLVRVRPAVADLGSRWGTVVPVPDAIDFNHYAVWVFIWSDEKTYGFNTAELEAPRYPRPDGGRPS